MDVFKLRDRLVSEYRRYIRSFIVVRDPQIEALVNRELEGGLFWPEPLIQLNPAFAPGDPIEKLIKEQVLLAECERIFQRDKAPGSWGKPLRLHKHQEQAIRIARTGANYVLTTGTGSGKSLSYIVPIVDHCLRSGPKNGRIKAIIVYPMNALANSQKIELEKFIHLGYPSSQGPLTFKSFTGQESEEDRDKIRENPPDILLTNFVMLELIMTRPEDERLVRAAADLKFLVLDELHTYRGRQGADVAMLVRRAREQFRSPGMQCVGTSATLAGGGTFLEQQKDVAAMASLLFGATVVPDHVIGETLQRLTPEPGNTAALKKRVADATQRPPQRFTDFIADPLSAWIETYFGLRFEEGSSRLRRAIPKTLAQAAKELSKNLSLPEDRCAAAMRDGLMAGYACEPNPETGLKPFAFRLHQFLSRGDTVFASIESEETRHLTVSGQQYSPGSGKAKILCPLVFCRECGQEYYRVFVVDGASGGSGEIRPRPEGEFSNDDNVREGYLYLNTTSPLPDELGTDHLPDDWFDDDDGRIALRRSQRGRIPKPLRVEPTGKVGSGIRVHFIEDNFLFCLGCGVSYVNRQTSERGKLGTLGIDRRSTATTILTLSTLQSLKDPELALDSEARKLLSFTDNRQDASLQAGHFNDFVQVGLLRGAVYEAAKRAGDRGMRHDELTQRVAEALDLPFAQYAAHADARYAERNNTVSAFHNYLGYQIYRDLQRGWQVVAPNLEQCGLIDIEYDSLEELCRNNEDWQKVPGRGSQDEEVHPALATATPRTRAKIARVLLDHLRRELAVKVNFLSPPWQEQLKQQCSQYLVPPWTIDEDDDKLEHAGCAFPRSKKHNEYGGDVFISERGGFASYLLRRGTLEEWNGPKLKRNDVGQIIPQLLKILSKAGLVTAARPPIEGTDSPGYQVPAACMTWKAGDGTHAYHDPVRMPNLPEGGRRTNDFFVRFYRDIALRAKGLEAREHTAQVPYERRIEREEAFRNAQLPLLFCSPTMELGVDIRQLNVVNMRNVPPTPANYAQRSGRAGRSGQPALVFTYCATLSQHDQYFFRQPERMVAGAVTTPRIDLMNEDLLRSHLHAIWLTETGARLGKSLRDILDLSGEKATLDVVSSTSTSLDNPEARSRAKDKATRVLATLERSLISAGWYRPEWIDRVLTNARSEFEAACRRWRSLFRSAQAQMTRATEVLRTAAADGKQRDEARRLVTEADSQIRLLTETQNIAQSDFYSYRYFASEGFLPGYNFPRLPLAAYIPGRRRTSGQDEFLSRPRFLAISEFGPRTFIYHEGSRYQIDRVILPVADQQGATILSKAKLCAECGYVHPILSSPGPDLCESCGAQLEGERSNLFRLQNVVTRRQDRINSDTEERVRKGYEIRTAIRFAEVDGNLARRNATAKIAGKIAFELAYGNTATLWRINLGWLKEKERDGFLLDLQKGKWLGHSADNDLDTTVPAGGQRVRVIPFVEDRKNCLVIKPIDGMSAEALTTLQYALKHAIQIVYQLEGSELASEPLPNRLERNAILLFEASEGGAGVLRHLVDDSTALARVAREALNVCHFDPETGADRRRAQRATEDCEAACYDCLLSYGNQRDHTLLDRTMIGEILLNLSRGSVESSTTGLSREGQFAVLKNACGSPLEVKWLEEVQKRKLRLPTNAQKLVEMASTRPDFSYDIQGARVAIYVDGDPHQHVDRKSRDAEVTERLRDQGWLVLRFGLDNDWNAIFSDNRGVFGEGAP